MEITKINDLIYLGNFKHVLYLTKEFTELNIDVIFNCCKEVTHKPTEKYIIEHYLIDDGSYASISPYIDLVADNIENNVKNNKRIYVHCVQGKSRSVAVLIYYLMKYHNLTYDAGYDTIKKVRPCISINTNFEKELRNLPN